MFANRTIRGIKVPAVAIMGVAVLLIVTYGMVIRKHKIRDPLERKIIDHPSCPGFDGWAVLHFFFFMVLGIMYPGHNLQVIAVSLGWELIEHLLGTTNIKMSGKRLQLIGDQDEDGNPLPQSDEAWWYGRFVTDNSFNLTGYMLGDVLSKYLLPAVI
jgi:hypothetical protein